MKRFYRILVVAVLVSMTGAPFAYAICRSRWQHGFYYTGCGASVEYAGEYLRACEPIDDYENDQQDGDWLVRSDGYCLFPYNCVQEEPFSVTYYKKCGGNLVPTSETDFNNGNCECP